jgi:hypothetical protein
MKKHIACFVTALAFVALSGLNATAADSADTYYYYDTSHRDDTARDAALREQSSQTWASKPPHSHTEEDAYNSALQKRETNPLYLIREQTQNSQIDSLRNSNLSAQESTPDYLNRDVTRDSTINATMETNRRQAGLDARQRQQDVQSQITGIQPNSYSSRRTTYESQNRSQFSANQNQQQTPLYTNRDAIREQRMNDHQGGRGR